MTTVYFASGFALRAILINYFEFLNFFELSNVFNSAFIVKESAVRGTFDYISPLLLHFDSKVYYYILDVIAICALYRINKQSALFYTYSPLSIVNLLSHSLTTLQNTLTVTSLMLACEGYAYLSILLLSYNSILFFYPVALLIPQMLIITKDSTNKVKELTKYTLVYLITTLSLLSLARYISNDWSFLNLYKNLIFAENLTPNTGLFWYLFMEIFSQFRYFFTVVLQLHAFIYVLPISIYLSHRPLLAFTFISGTISIFKSYPSIGDVSVYTSLIFLFPDLYQHARYPKFVATLTIVAAGLLPLFRHLWLRAVTGNANFYYASTLLWTFSNGMLLVELLYAEAKRLFMMTIDKDTDISKYKIKQV
ncbi:hypothetical protein E3Q23_03301 [Wallemia mellicola]|uniref:PIG-U-domain-containing protein n=1 Tax=Wallemia mellicola TaxID=1708541 RepID=A0A4T0LS88_9BASI|nr:hypothetical protein E3Q23_03301 [Wallemia mellicola]TIB73366.1 hypothetical protein E3Q24_01176 [Wallemia mellicola]TIC12359.1 PIG-U-domain-containing protein [Wallemia mellicola]TIC25035.1 PIG-U-domain-containing protein [Wallemia mellicola]TIC45247.1 PIG-U-domain-containing protein [Wallemia mellicola]